jgi:hypothetical protein
MNCPFDNSSIYPLGAQEVRSFYFKAFPRREKTFQVLLTRWNSSTGQKEIVSDFPIANPAWKKSFPVWKPEPLPATKTNGDLEFTLAKLTSGLSSLGDSRRAANPTESGTGVEFEVRQGGQVLTNWQPVKVYAQDATGNELENRSWSNSLKDGKQQMHFQGTLDPNEPAWKLRVEFTRTSGFAPEETWSINVATNIVTNSWGQVFTNSLARTNLLGASVELVGLRRRFAGVHPTRTVQVLFRINSLPSNHRFSLSSAIDDQGRALRRSGSSYSSTQCDFDLEAMPDSASLIITVALHPSRVVEFLAKPQVVR